MKKKFQQLFKKSESLSTEQYKKIKAVESRLGILHGLCKLLQSRYKLAEVLVPKTRFNYV